MGAVSNRDLLGENNKELLDMIRNRKILTMSSFAAMFFLGVGSAIIGAASRNIGLSPDQIGLLLAIQNVGFILSVITV